MRIKLLQPIWEFMLDVTLYGMNIGPASLPHYSGETHLLNNIHRILHMKNDAEITVFDVGANNGDYAPEIHATLGATARLFCFEPSHATYDILKENTRGIDSIFLNNRGFSDNVEELELFSDMHGSGLASLYDRRLDHQGTYLHNKETVRLSTIDKTVSKL
jgi:FkbM family methyltransferase